MSTSSRFAVAVHILTLLASAEGPVPSSLIAGSVGTNPALIRRLVAQLAEAGFMNWGCSFMNCGDQLHELGVQPQCHAMRNRVFEKCRAFGVLEDRNGC